MKTILVPTDFSPSALDCIPALAAQYDTQKVSFVFVHMFKLSDSIGDLLMLSRRSREFEYISDEFYNSCTAYKSQYQNIEAIKIEFFYGSTVSMFKNFLEANDVDCVLNLADCSCEKINKSSIDPATLINRSGLPVASTIKLVKEDAKRPVRVIRDLQLEEA